MPKEQTSQIWEKYDKMAEIFFWEWEFVDLSSQSWVGHISDDFRTSKDSLQVCFTDLMRCSVSKPEGLECQIVHLLALYNALNIKQCIKLRVKIRGGMGKISESILRAIIYDAAVFRSATCCSVSKSQKIEAKLCTFWLPVKNRGGVGECLGDACIGSNHWNIFDGAPLDRLGD